MERMKFSVLIDAPKEKVWHAMLDDRTYREWTAEFAAGSHYVGDWSEDSKILFLAPDEKGAMGGMVSRIRANRPYEHISIEHVGLVQDGEEDTTSDAVRGWAGAQENYTFRETGGGTEVLVEMDTAPEHAEMFRDIWPKALGKLKTLAEA